MGIKIEGNLFYVHSKNMSLIIENHEGDLLLRHIGGKITAYHGSNALFEKDHAFSGNPTPDDRTYSFDTQRQILGYMALVIFASHPLVFHTTLMT